MYVFISWNIFRSLANQSRFEILVEGSPAICTSGPLSFWPDMALTQAFKPMTLTHLFHSSATIDYRVCGNVISLGKIRSRHWVQCLHRQPMTSLKAQTIVYGSPRITIILWFACQWFSLGNGNQGSLTRDQKYYKWQATHNFLSYPLFHVLTTWFGQNKHLSLIPPWGPPILTWHCDVNFLDFICTRKLAQS